MGIFLGQDITDKELEKQVHSAFEIAIQNNEKIHKPSFSS